MGISKGCEGRDCITEGEQTAVVIHEVFIYLTHGRHVFIDIFPFLRRSIVRSAVQLSLYAIQLLPDGLDAGM